jgi:hypothetical protein
MWSLLSEWRVVKVVRVVNVDIEFKVVRVVSVDIVVKVVNVVNSD